MGLLDDAIREHLELKRRHGADPDEVSRQEREALGAPVRGEFAKPAGADEGEAEGPAAVQAPPEGADVADVPEIAEPPEMPGEPEPEPGEPQAAEPEPQPGTEEDPWLVEDLADPEPEPEPASEPPTQERPAARAASDEAPEGDDVLEETPEFLQETPEHDRLWFEQKPPRDFDWDK
jgi:hypothetical protein